MINAWGLTFCKVLNNFILVEAPAILWCVAWHQSVVCYLHAGKKNSEGYALWFYTCSLFAMLFVPLVHAWLLLMGVPASRSRIQLNMVWIFCNKWKYSGQSIDSNWPSFNTAISAGWCKCCDLFSGYGLLLFSWFDHWRKEENLLPVIFLVCSAGWVDLMRQASQ